jgi:hypothetical protein
MTVLTAKGGFGGTSRKPTHDTTPALVSFLAEESD